MKKNTQLPLAYSGKYINYNNKTYFLAPEVTKRGCKGCDLLGNICNSTLTDYCRQGYILKAVK